METSQITGEMVITNVERLNNPQHNTHSDVFKAIMDTNLMEFRLLKGGVAELSYYGPTYRSRLTPKVFVESLTEFMATENIAELEFTGNFLFVQTGGKEPSMTKVVVDKGEVTSHAAAIAWAE